MTAIAIDGRENFEFLWNSIDWNGMKNNVNRLQARIVKAVQEGNKERVRSLQRLIARSLSARFLSVFSRIDHAIWKATWKWSVRRHPKKPCKWIKDKYFQRQENRDWVFGEKNSSERLLRMSDIPIQRHVKIKADANPYDPQWYDYFARRSKPKTAGFLNELYQCLGPVR